MTRNLLQLPTGKDIDYTIIANLLVLSQEFCRFVFNFKFLDQLEEFLN